MAIPDICKSFPRYANGQTSSSLTLFRSGYSNACPRPYAILHFRVH